MIEINLCPPDKRRKSKSKFLKGFNIPPEVVIGSAGGLIILLLFVHLFLTGLKWLKLATYKNLQKQWQEVLPSKDTVDGVIENLRKLQASQTAMQGLPGGDDLSWARKLNIISDSLPNEAWLRKVALANGMLFIEGSAISKSGKEMTNVHNFTANLKKDEKFVRHFEEIELGSIQRRNIQKIEIADFAITAHLYE